MVIYQLGDGRTVQAESELSPEELDHIAGQQSPASTPAPTSSSSFLGNLEDLGKSFIGGAERTGAEIGRGVSSLVGGLVNAGGSPVGAFDQPLTQDASPQAVAKSKAAAQLMTKYLAEHPAPTWQDAHDAFSKAKYMADALGSVAPYVVGGLVGGVPAVAAEGALQGGGNEAARPGSTPASIATASALGGGLMALPVPFAKAGGGFLSGVGRSIVANTALGAAQGATANIPEAVASGDVSDAIPSFNQIASGATLGGLLGGTLGAAFHTPDLFRKASGGEATEGTPTPKSKADIQKAADVAAKARLADRIGTKAQQLGANLNNVKYGSPHGAEAVLESVHNDIAEGIKAMYSQVADRLDPKQAQSVGDLIERAQAQGSLRSARNKKKGNVSDDDINRLTSAVGDLVEGRALIDLVRQSNHLTDLFRNGLKGGLSQYTDIFSPIPFERAGNENGSMMSHMMLAPRFAYLTQPHFWAPGLGVWAGGRAIDALTGRRSKVGAFVRSFSKDAQPLDLSGARSVIEAKAKAAADAERQRLADLAEQERLLERQRLALQQQRVENKPGLNGFYRSLYDQTGILPAEGTKGMLMLFGRGAITPSEFEAWHNDPQKLMAGNVGNHIFDAIDRLAQQGLLQRDPQWEQQPQTQPQVSVPSGVLNPEAYNAQAAGNQARVTAAQSRVAETPFEPAIKQRINDAIAAIGRTNNRQHAAEIRDSLMRSFVHPEHQAYARQEIDPLVAQIRHPTPEAAEAASTRKVPQPSSEENTSTVQTASPSPSVPLELLRRGYLEGGSAAFAAALVRRYGLRFAVLTSKQVPSDAAHVYALAKDGTLYDAAGEHSLAAVRKAAAKDGQTVKIVPTERSFKRQYVSDTEGAKAFTDYSDQAVRQAGEVADMLGITPK